MPKPQELRDLPVEEIEPNLYQPRRHFDEAALGAEVQVRTLPGQKLRLEILFDNPEGALSLGEKSATQSREAPRANSQAGD